MAVDAGEKEVLFIIERVVELRIVCTNVSEYTGRLQFLENSIKGIREDAANQSQQANAKWGASNNATAENITGDASVTQPDSRAAATSDVLGPANQDPSHIPANESRDSISSVLESPHWEDYIRQDLYTPTGSPEMGVNDAPSSPYSSRKIAEVDQSAGGSNDETAELFLTRPSLSTIVEGEDQNIPGPPLSPVVEREEHDIPGQPISPVDEGEEHDIPETPLSTIAEEEDQDIPGPPFSPVDEREDQSIPGQPISPVDEGEEHDIPGTPLSTIVEEEEEHDIPGTPLPTIVEKEGHQIHPRQPSARPSPSKTSNSDARTLDILIHQAKRTFGQTGMELPCDDLITKVQANEVDDFFMQFRPRQYLSTSAINPLISSFDWAANTLVLHSSKIDVDEDARRAPWEIPPSYDRVIVPSCYKHHWTLLCVDLRQHIVRRYNSLASKSVPLDLQEALQCGLSRRCQDEQGNVELEYEEDISLQQINAFDCGLYTILNAEYLSLSPEIDVHDKTLHCLRQRYLERLTGFAIRSKHDLRLQRMVFEQRCPQRIKRACPSEASESSLSSKKMRSMDWEPPTRAGIDSRQKWMEARETLTQSILDPSLDKIANRRRAEHLLRMIDAIASDSVLESWRTDTGLGTQRPQGSSPSSAADAIYSLVSRGQTRSFRDNVILRVGKYLFASRILDRVGYLRSLGAPSKQRVASAGSTGEGNAVTRALREFVREVHHGITQDAEDREVGKCKQWWKDGKIWKLLADAVDPAVLLLIPSGHTMADKCRLWDSDFTGLKSNERRPFVDSLVHLRPDLQRVVRTVEEQLESLGSDVKALLKGPQVDSA